MYILKRILFFVISIIILQHNLFAQNIQPEFSASDFVISLFSKYQDIKIYSDAGLIYRLEANEGSTITSINQSTNQTETTKISQTRSLYNAEDKGIGIGFRYTIGTGLNIADWNSKNIFGLGLLIDSKIVYSSDSSIYQFGFGIDEKLFWIINLYLGVGYASFNKQLPVVDHYETQNTNSDPTPILKEKDISGRYAFVGVGIDYPITSSYDVFLNLTLISMIRVIGTEQA